MQGILGVLKDTTRAAADDLAIRFGVSRETIRRDLAKLEADGMVRRTHGGALLIQPVVEQPFKDRRTAHTAEKQAIAAAAVQLVRPRDCCFIDAGSTTACFAQALASIDDVHVVTNSFDVALSLREVRPSAEVLLLGGTLGRDVPGTYGTFALEQLATLRADIAFISPVGIDIEAGVSYFDLGEADVARAMVRNARQRVVLADASKCGVVSRVLICACSDVDVLVTDVAPSPGLRAAGIGKILYGHDGQSGQKMSKLRRRS